MVEKAYKRAIDILIENKENLEKLAAKLLSDEVIFYEDVEEIFGKRLFASSIENQVESMKIKEISSIKKKLHQKPENADAKINKDDNSLVDSKIEENDNNTKDDEISRES